MPGRYSRVGSRRTASSSKSATRSKKVYSKYAKAAKSAKTRLARTARAKPGSARVKRTVLSNARAIARLKDQQYGPIQRNHGHTNTEVHITQQYPAAIHLNNLYSGVPNQVVHNSVVSPQVIQNEVHTLGTQANVMNSYERTAPLYNRVPIHMADSDDISPQPQGDYLWKQSTLQFKFTGWVEDTWVDVWIIKQMVGKPKGIYDPWRESASLSPHGSYLPYTLPQFRGMSGKDATNWLPPGYKVIAHKRRYLDSIGQKPPIGIAHEALSGNAVAEAITSSVSTTALIHNGRAPQTGPHAYMNFKITPNMLVKQLESSAEADGQEDMDFNSNANESRTRGPYSFDNIDPRQNIWAIVSTSDVGGFLDSTIDQHHRVTFTYSKSNVWRDKSNDHKQFVH